MPALIAGYSGIRGIASSFEDPLAALPALRTRLILRGIRAWVSAETELDRWKFRSALLSPCLRGSRLPAMSQPLQETLEAHVYLQNGKYQRSYPHNYASFRFRIGRRPLIKHVIPQNVELRLKELPICDATRGLREHSYKRGGVVFGFRLILRLS